MTLYFVPYGGTRKKLAVGTEVECRKAMMKNLEEYSVGKIYYTRNWKTPDGIEVIDYGSWSNFYHLVPDDVVKKYESDEVKW